MRRPQSQQTPASTGAVSQPQREPRTAREAWQREMEDPEPIQENSADAAESILCATTLLGLVLSPHSAGADRAAALADACFAVREGREAWHGELACRD